VCAFLSKQFKRRFADAVRQNAVAELVKETMIGPASAIATTGLWESERRHIAGWLRGREKDPAMFKRLCTGIHEDVRQNVWQMQFNVFRRDGGVDSVTTSGVAVPFEVRDIRIDAVKSAGEFYFPLEG
jgi:hypothetical protein